MDNRLAFHTSSVSHMRLYVFHIRQTHSRYDLHDHHVMLTGGRHMEFKQCISLISNAVLHRSCETYPDDKHNIYMFKIPTCWMSLMFGFTATEREQLRRFSNEVKTP